MLVTFTNNSSADLHLAQLYCTVPAGLSIQTRRSRETLQADETLKALVLAGTVTLAFTLEAGDNAALGFGDPLLSYSNTTRPAASAVPIYTAIWNTDDNAENFSTGSAWTDSLGNVT